MNCQDCHLRTAEIFNLNGLQIVKSITWNNQHQTPIEALFPGGPTTLELVIFPHRETIFRFLENSSLSPRHLATLAHLSCQKIELKDFSHILFGPVFNYRRLYLLENWNGQNKNCHTLIDPSEARWQKYNLVLAIVYPPCF